jgi:hypothetical protein
MPAYTYYEDLADPSDQIEFTAADVEECADRAQLQEWLDGLEVLGDNIRAQLDAARISGEDDDAWVLRASRALAFVGIGCGRIRRRMKALGFNLNSQEAKIAELERRLQTMKAEAAYGRAFVHFARLQLPSHEFDRLDRDALMTLERKAPPVAA